MRQRFEDWMKLTEGKKGTTAYQYANSINKISEHYSKETGKSIDIYAEKDINLIRKISSDYAKGGNFSVFGQGGNGTIRNAIATYLRFLISLGIGEEIQDFQMNSDSQKLTETDMIVSEMFPESHNFTYERDLKNSLVSQASQLFPGYKIFGDHEEGVEFSIEGKRIDLLMESINDSSLLAIELKSGEADYKVFGQISMYLGLLSKKFPNRGIRGVIIAGKINETLQYACLSSNQVFLKTYQMQLALNDAV